MGKVFQRIGANNPGRSVFNLSYEKKFTCDMGQLIPVMCDEVVPGDVFNIGNEIVVRFTPMIAPILHEVNVYVHYFFVPYRLLWDDWEDFITGGVLGDVATTPPVWACTDPNTTGTLWDYLGFPLVATLPVGSEPLAFPQYAYNFIYNEYYRDETLIAEVDIDVNENILNRCWEKDYFTSALLWQQRGTAPALPISGHSHAIWAGAVNGTLGWPAVDGTVSANFLYDNEGAKNYPPYDANTKTALERGIPSIPKANMDANTVDLSSATTFNVSDLRLAFQIQRWLERNARAGARYTEFLLAHFGASPRDERLQRPEYIGGSKTPCIVSEVLQTSSTDVTTPQGNLAGHGISIDRRFVGKYRAQEFGLIMGIMSIMPRTAYQNGINRQWLRRTKYDFYFPEFANLSEQGILNNEIYTDPVDNTLNNTVFGFQGRYDEMRTKQSQVCAQMRDTFDYWHLGRQFTGLPNLNGTFVTCIPDKRIFAVQDEDTLIVNYANIIKAIRPMPIMSNPGLIDH